MRLYQTLAAAMAAAVLAAGSAQAAVLFQGQGTWSSTAQVTPISTNLDATGAPNGGTWTFSFYVDNPIPAPAGSNTNPDEYDTPFINGLTFTLNGAPVAVSANQLSFYSINEGLGFDIFLNGGPVDPITGHDLSFNVYGGTDFGSTGTVTPDVFLAGTFPNLDVDVYDQTFTTGSPPEGQGSVTVTDNYTPPPPPGVPEPASWALMIVGLGMAGGALRRRPALAL